MTPRYPAGMAKKTMATVLSENLKWLMGQHKGELDSTTKIEKRAKARGRTISQRTVHRCVSGLNNDQPYFASTDALDALGAAFGIEPWLLINPKLPEIYLQGRLSLEEREKVERILQLQSELSPAGKAATQAELFADAPPAVKEMMQADPYRDDKLVEKGWSAAGKAVSRRVG